MALQPAMRHNLPAYLRRWVIVVILSYLLGAWFGRVLLLDYAGTSSIA